MSSVYEDGVECPVCHGNFAHTDLDCRTNERMFACARCGFYYETKIIEHNGRSFWQTTEERPISKDCKKVAAITPTFGGDISGNEEAGPKWNSVEFRTLPSFTVIPDGFGVEEAKD
jgi:hypothetical protein